MPYYCTKEQANLACTFLTKNNIDGGSQVPPYDPWAQPGSPYPTTENWAQWLTDTLHSTQSCAIIVDWVLRYGPEGATKMLKDVSEPKTT